MEVLKNDDKVVSIAPENAELYEILKKLPSPKKQMNLNKDQRYWWKWFGATFLKTDQLAELDLIHLQRAAFWMDARCKAYAVIEEKGYFGGLVQTYTTGAQNISPHLTVVEKADKNLDEISAHFGLSIRDRQKLKKVQAPDSGQLDLFETIEKMMKKGAAV